MPVRFAQHLVERGLVPAPTTEEALRRRESSGGALDTALLESGAMSETGLLAALSELTRLQPIDLGDFQPNPEMARFIPANVADRLCAVPLSIEDKTLHVACAYPPPARALEEVAVLLGKKLHLWIALEMRIRDWIATVYGAALSQRFSRLLMTNRGTRTSPSGTVAPPGLARVTDPRPTSDSKSAPISAPVSAPAPMPNAAASTAARPSPIAAPIRGSFDFNAAAARSAVAPIPSTPARNAIPSPAPAPPSAPLATPAARASVGSMFSFGAPRAAPAPAPAAAAPAVRDEPIPLSTPKRRATAQGESRLEDAINREMVEQIARAVADEPILLDVRKKGLQQKAVNGAQSAPPAAAKSDFPAVVVFGNPRAAPAPAPAAAMPASPADWTLQQARAALRDASRDRDRIIQVALQFARGAFEFAAAFAVIRGAAMGWAAEGDGAEAFRDAKVSFPLDAASAFRTVAMTRSSYIGPPPQDTVTGQYLSQMRRSPRMMFLFPVEVKQHLICILYGDNAKRAFSQLRLSELLLLCQDLPAAFQELMIYRKQRFGTGRRWALDFEEVVGPRLPAGAVDWSPSAAPGTTETRGRAASTPGRMMQGPANPPSDFGPLLKKLTGPEAAARASAIAELARTPEASARVLAEKFPGPTAWTRVAISELPEPDELGPIPAALSRLGRPGAQALAPLLDSPDPDVRYYALLTAGSLPFPELVGGVLRGLFDLEPDLSSAARAAAGALRRVPRLVSSMRELRQELAGKDPVRRALAARALGVLHDREAIDGLINLTGSDDGLCAQASTDALREITRASFGSDQRRWASWWAENRSRSRAEWLVAALRHPELEVRLSAIEELAKAINDTLGYFADAPAAEREAAAKRWETALPQDPRLRNLQ